MHLDLKRCVQCPPTPPSCDCNSNQHCVQTSQTCDACVTAICQDNSSPNAGGSGSVSKGALAGAVIGALIFFAIVTGGLWYLHKQRKLKEIAARRALEPKPEVPAPADAVLNRPDPNEKMQSPPSHVRMYSAESATTIDLNPNQRSGPQGNSQVYDPSVGPDQASFRNPFADQSSIITSSTQSQSNVIPIQLVPYGSVQTPTSVDVQNGQAGPSRAVRSSDSRVADYELAHVNVSNDSVPSRKQLAPSMRSDITSSTTATYATDLFNDHPAIVTRQQGRILGVSKAQVVEVPSSSTTPRLSPNAARTSRLTAGRSPLAQSSFTPHDILETDEQAEQSPFGDAAKANSMASSRRAGENFSVRTNDTYGDELSVRTTGTYGSHASAREDDTRYSVVGANISNARRVIVAPGGSSLARANSINSSNPRSSQNPGIGQHVYRQSFAVSEASSRADSILEAFPFVPPSPISEHSTRSEQSGRSVSGHSAATSPELEAARRRAIGASLVNGGSVESTDEHYSYQPQSESSDQAQQSIERDRRNAHASLDQ